MLTCLPLSHHQGILDALQRAPPGRPIVIKTASTASIYFLSQDFQQEVATSINHHQQGQSFPNDDLVQSIWARTSDLHGQVTFEVAPDDECRRRARQ